MKTKTTFGKRMLSFALTFLLVLSCIPLSIFTSVEVDAATAYGDYGIRIVVDSKYCQHCGRAQMPINKISINTITLNGTTLTVNFDYYFKHSSCSSIKNTEERVWKYFDCNKTYSGATPTANSGDVFLLYRSAGHSAEWSFNNNTHSGTCTLCNKTVTENCSGGTATCTTKATCSVCKNQYGTVNANNHSYGAWSQTDVDGVKMHTRTCSRDASHIETVRCSGGMDTCVKSAVCNTCGNEYGSAFGHNYVDGNCVNCGLTENGDFYISTAEQLMFFAVYVNMGNKDANATLTADIDLSGYDWKTICETGLYYNGYGEDLGYSGTFDGNGHTISNVTVKSSTAMDASCGLFGTVSGEIKNLGVENFTFVDGGKDIRTGAIVGQLITTGKVSNCYVNNATINPGEHVTGGIAGCVYDGTIENCYVVNSTITGSSGRYGYIVGDSRGDVSDTDRPGTVTNCYTDNATVYSGRVGNITNCEVKTAEQFNSGEVAYLLQGQQTDTVWGQKINEDEYPVFGRDKVYYGFISCASDAVEEYTNLSSATDTKPNHTEGSAATCLDLAVCANCGESYGSLNPDNHASEDTYFTNTDNGTHEEFHSCCKVIVGEEGHNFEYTVEGNTITAKCVNCGYEGSVTLNAPENVIYDGAMKEATVSGEIKGAEISAVTYMQEGEVVDYAVDAGIYTASISVGDATVEIQFEIEKVVLSISYVSIEDFTYSESITRAVTGISLSGILGADDISVNFDGATVQTPSALAGDYTTVSGLTEVTLDGYDSHNYCIAEYDENTVFSSKYTIKQYPVSISPENQSLEENSEITQGLYAVDTELPEGHTLSNVILEVDENDLIWADTESVVITNADGEDVTASFLVSSNSGIADYYCNYNENGFCIHCGSFEPATLNEDGYYEIDNAGKLYWFAQQVNNGETTINAVLTDDIVVNENVLAEDLTLNKGEYRQWTRIGGNYWGTFDGQGHTISGLYNSEVSGIFYHVCGTVRNLGVDDTFFSDQVDGFALCYGILGTLENCFAYRCVVEAENNLTFGYSYDVDLCPKNCYYLDTVCYDDFATAMTAEQFGSGEVTYLLNNGVTDGTQVFYQTIGEDEIPSAQGDTVYLIECFAEPFYSNILYQVIQFYSPCGSAETSIVNGLKAIGVDSSYANREKIAEANGITDYIGSDEQNIQLLKLLKAGNLVSPDASQPSYICDANGNKLTGWVTAGGKKYYFETPGILKTGWAEEDDVWYYFNSNGTLYTGWLEDNGRMYYLTEADGSMATGLLEIDGAMYYFSETNYPTGYMYVNKWSCVDNIWYFSGADGKLVSNTWVEYEGKWSYLGFDYKMVTSSLVEYEGETYYVDSEGYRTSGWINVDRVWYYFDADNGDKATLQSENMGDEFYAVVSTNMNSEKVVTATGRAITIETNVGADNQIWHFSRRSSGAYRLTNVQSGECLDVVDGLATIGADVQTYLDNGTSAQRWIFANTGDGNYMMIPVCAVDEATDSDVVLDVNYASDADGTRISLSKRHGGTNQLFNIQIVHIYNEDGFCKACDAYQPADYVKGTDEWGNEVYYFEVSNAGQLFWFAEKWNDGTIYDYAGEYGFESVRLTNDIELNPGYVFNSDGTFTGGENPREWTPIENYQWRFFDGQNHTISGLYVNQPEKDNVGLFGSSYYYDIKNLTLTNGYVSGKNYVGSFMGYGDSPINNCISDITIVATGSSVGGLAGYSGDIYNSINYGEVTGDSYVGGLSGGTYSGSVYNSINKGNVTGRDEIAGIMGGHSGNVYSSYSIGKLNVTSESGDLYGIINGNCENSFYLAESETEDGGKTAKQFASGEVTYLLNGSRSTTEDAEYDPIVWYQTCGEGLPAYSGEIVYQYDVFAKCGKTDEPSKAYANEDIGFTAPDHTFKYVCSEECDECGYENENAVSHNYVDEKCEYCGKNDPAYYVLTLYLNNQMTGETFKLEKSSEDKRYDEYYLSEIFRDASSFSNIPSYNLLLVYYSENGTVYIDYNSTRAETIGSLGIPQNAELVIYAHNLCEYCGGYNNEYDICQSCGGYKSAGQNSDGYYEIASAGNLYWFAQQVNNGSKDIKAVLINDIYCDTGINWTPIKDFAGVLDGQGHVISDIDCSLEGGYAGLFKTISVGANVKNLGIINSSFEGYSAAPITLENYGTLENCFVYMTEVTAELSSGAICCYSGDYYEEYQYEDDNGDILTDWRYVGTGTVENCYYLSDSETDEIDGTTAKTTEQFASGEVTYLLNKGVTDGTQVFYQTCGEGIPTFSGDTVYQWLEYTTCDKSDEPTAHYVNEATDDVVPEHTHDNSCDTDCNVCGNIREITHTYDNDCDTDCNVCGDVREITHTYDNACDTNCNVCDEVREVPDHVYTCACDTACDVCEFTRDVEDAYENGFCTGCDDYQKALLNEDGYYEITNAGQLYWYFSNASDTNAILMEDIVVNENLFTENGELVEDKSTLRPWLKYTAISGNVIFDGNGHTISGLYLEFEFVAFCFENCGTIKHLGIINSYFYTDNTEFGIAGICCINYGIIEDCYSGAVAYGIRHWDVTKEENGAAICHSNESGAIIRNCLSLDDDYDICIENRGTETNCYIDSPNTYPSRGQLTYLLNNGVTDGTQVWYQNIDNDEEYDKYPQFSGGTVYYGYACTVKKYSNYELTEESTPHSYEDEVCTKCGDCTFEFGDVNCDGEITISDATAIQKYLAKLTTFTTASKVVADVDDDGRISIRDVTYIQMFVAKMITTFPAEFDDTREEELEYG